MPGSVVHGPINSIGLLPDLFHGDPKELEAFFLQLEIQFHLNKEGSPTVIDQILYAFFFCRGVTSDWTTPLREDFHNHKNNQWKPETKTVFGSWKGLKALMRREFRDIHRERAAERILCSLNQKGSVASYPTAFQSYAVKISWNEPALMAFFHQGLKDEIKYKMIRGIRPDRLKEMIEKVVTIDNRLYELRLETKGQSDLISGTKARRPAHTPKAYYGLHPVKVETLSLILGGDKLYNGRNSNSIGKYYSDQVKRIWYILAIQNFPYNDIIAL